MICDRAACRNVYQLYYYIVVYCRRGQQMAVAVATRRRHSRPRPPSPLLGSRPMAPSMRRAKIYRTTPRCGKALALRHQDHGPEHFVHALLPLSSFLGT